MKTQAEVKKINESAALQLNFINDLSKLRSEDFKLYSMIESNLLITIKYGLLNAQLSLPSNLEQASVADLELWLEKLQFIKTEVYQQQIPLVKIVSFLNLALFEYFKNENYFHKIAEFLQNRKDMILHELKKAEHEVKTALAVKLKKWSTYFLHHGKKLTLSLYQNSFVELGGKLLTALMGTCTKQLKRHPTVQQGQYNIKEFCEKGAIRFGCSAEQITFLKSWIEIDNLVSLMGMGAGIWISYHLSIYSLFRQFCINISITQVHQLFKKISVDDRTATVSEKLLKLRESDCTYIVQSVFSIFDAFYFKDYRILPLTAGSLVTAASTKHFILDSKFVRTLNPATIESRNAIEAAKFLFYMCAGKIGYHLTDTLLLPVDTLIEKMIMPNKFISFIKRSEQKGYFITDTHVIAPSIWSVAYWNLAKNTVEVEWHSVKSFTFGKTMCNLSVDDNNPGFYMAYCEPPLHVPSCKIEQPPSLCARLQ